MKAFIAWVFGIQMAVQPAVTIPPPVPPPEPTPIVISADRTDTVQQIEVLTNRLIKAESRIAALEKRSPVEVRTETKTEVIKEIGQGSVTHDFFNQNVGIVEKRLASAEGKIGAVETNFSNFKTELLKWHDTINLQINRLCLDSFHLSWSNPDSLHFRCQSDTWWLGTYPL